MRSRKPGWRPPTIPSPRSSPTSPSYRSSIAGWMKWPRSWALRRSSTTRSTSTTSPAWSPALTRARVSATASSPTFARPTRSCTSCARIATRASCTPRGRCTRCATSRRSRPSSRSPTSSRPSGVAIAALQAGRPVRTVPLPEEAPNAARDLGSLTAKPVLFLANVDEGSEEVPAEIAAHAAAQGAGAVAVSARIEAELAELDDQDATAMREELGVSESGLQRVVRGAFELLRLIAFFTAGEAKPAQSWHLREGLTAWHAAGEIHSDIQRGFVRAEVIGWQELLDAGGYAGARERGVLRLEGRDYVMRDGDVITVRFTP